MKKKFGKRIISILLSAMMVITMIPTFAITVFADANGGIKSEYSYLVSGATLQSDVTSSNVTWDSNNNSAGFASSSYVKLNDKPLSGVTATSGFIVSYEINAGDLGADTWAMNFVGGTNRMTFVNGNSEWDQRPSLVITNGSKTRIYKGVFTDTAHLSTTYSKNSNDCLWWDTFRMTYVMNTDGSLDLIVKDLTDNSDSFTVTYKSNYGSTSNGGGMTDAEVAEAVSSLTDYYIGAGDNTLSHDYTGNIKNVRFFASSEAKALQLAMIDYENKMADGKVYKNLSAAYNAYLDANKALDSYFYGDSNNTVTSANLTTLTSNLTTAIGNMTEWTQQGAKVTTKHGVFAGDTTSGAESYPTSDGGSAGYYASALHNLLYVQTGLEKTGTYCQAYTENGSDPKIKKELYYPDATLLYVDSNTKATFPIMLRVYCDKQNNNRWVLTAYQCTGTADTDPVETRWSLTMKNGGYYKWFGGGDNLDFAWSYHYGASDGTMLNSTSSNNSSYSSSHTLQTAYKGNWIGSGAFKKDKTFANYITYTGSMDDDTAYAEILPDFQVNCNSENSWKVGDGLSGEVKGGTGNSNGSNGKIHVINYGRLVRKINSYSGSAFGVDISKYTQNRKNGSNKHVSDFFTAFDAMTSYDLHSYFTSSNNWDGCQSAMTSVIDGMNNQSITADVDNYSALRAAITYEGVITNLGDNTVHSVREMAAITDGADTYSNFTAFVDAYDAATAHMAALNGGNYSTDSTASDLATALIDAFNALGIKGAEAPTITGNTFIGKNETVTITNTDTNGATVHYTIAYDGEENPSVSGTLSNTSETISVFGGSDEYGTALVSAWAVAAGSDLTSSVEHLNCVNKDYEADTLVYQESFDGASIDGTEFLTGSTNGKNGTIKNNGTAHIEASAGADYDKRTNVLKIDAATAASRGNYVQLVNPLSSSINKAYAKDRGVTISFWRHMNADCAAWLNAVNFTSYDTEHTENRFRYATITATGRLTFVQRDNDNGNGVNGGWMDYFPYDNDITNHSASSNTGFWTNIALTVDAKAATVGDAFKIYINGVPHDVRSTDLAEIVRSKGEVYSSMSDSEIINAFLDFVTDRNTHLDFGYGGYDESDKSLDMWLDDIRIYTKPLTQVEINNMYTDEFTDAKKAGVDYMSSTSHDPTNVTVYTLGSDVTTDNNGVKAAGSKVGQEFIDYYGVDLTTCTKEYYSFGTGLTVYHSYDNLNWTCVGDSEGRFAYQNQELFVNANGEAQPYYTTLSAPLAHAAQGSSVNGSDVRAGAAGKLVWAPHVCYNLTTDKWMYYGSTSAWNSDYSTVFLLTSDYVDHGYKYSQMIVKTHGNDHEEGDSTRNPETGNKVNAIDSCVYYGHNSDGSIDKSQLYCLYGSWCDIMVKTLNADGTRSDGEDDLGTNISVAHGGGEGGYMTYENGYYYYFITPEANGWNMGGGNYHLRVFRSTSPTSGFVSVAGTAANTTADPHGNAMLTAYDNSTVDYKYTSTGHTSFYEAYNGYGEHVYINAAHTREYSHDSKPIEDGALSTRQIWLIGNVAIQNPVAFTTDGWPVMFPKIYDNTFSLHNKTATSSERNYFTAYDIDGVYASNQTTTNGVVSNEEIYKIFAINSTSGVIVDENTITTHNFTLEHNNNQTYIHLTNNDGTDYAEGVIANQGTNGSAVPMFSFLIENGSSAAYHVWGVKNGENPTTEEIQEALEAPISTYTTVNGTAYYKGVDATGGYSKVAYCSTTTNQSASELDAFYEYMRMLLPKDIVLVYDGDNNNRPSAPVVFTNRGNGNNNQVIKYVECTTSGLDLTKNWSGTVNDASLWPGSRAASDSFGYASDHQSNSGTQNDPTNRYWWNALYYTGSGASANNNYYEKFTNPNFYAVGAYGNTEKNGNIPAPESSIYVINYKPILDILNGNTKLTGTNKSWLDVYDDVKANKYTPTSTMQFYRAMELVMGVNPTNPKYDYASDTEAAVKAFSADMQQALAVFNIVNLERRADLTKFDTAYERADAFMNSQDGRISQYDKNSVVALKNALTATNVSKYANADEETRADYGTAVQTDADNLADDINEAYEGLTLAAVDPAAYEAVNITVHNLDPEAYDNGDSITTAINVSSEVSTDTVEYGDSTITFVTETDQTKVDAVTDVMESNLNASIKQYNVNASEADVKEIGANNGQYYTDTNKATYGTKLTFRADDPKTAWFLELTTATTTKQLAFAGSGAKFEARVLGNIKVKSVSRSEELPYRVTIVRNYDNDPGKAPVEYLNYVASGSEFELPDAPALALYTFDGYYINGSKIDLDSVDSITVNEDIDIVAKYNYDESASYAINATDINNNAHNSTYAYNNKVELNGGSGTYAWIEAIDETHYRPFYIGEDVSFFATESTTLKAVSEEDFNAYKFSVPTINLRKSGTISSGTKTIYNGQVIAENFDNIREWGILIGVPAATEGITPDASNLIIENTGTQSGYRVVRAKSTKFVGANQFSIAINNVPAGAVYRAYVIYDRGEGTAPITVYTDVM